MKIVLLGPPGSGKGTQAHIICEKYNLPHISTGDIFRANLANKTELGLKAKAYMDRGELVPDELTISIVVDRLQQSDCQKGFVFDGFPRNLAQAKELDKMVELDKAIMIHLDDEEIINRLSKRRMCKVCGNPTHMDWLVEDKCEKCGGEVYQREDDAPATIKARLEKQKLPQDVIDFYKAKGIYEQITSTDTKEETFKLVDEILKKL
ncbi:MAG: adenylate kinase [Clostridia bacterium]|nr:adenylate kinase [Clostridia bacterium]